MIIVRIPRERHNDNNVTIFPLSRVQASGWNNSIPAKLH